MVQFNKLKCCFALFCALRGAPSLYFSRKKSASVMDFLTEKNQYLNRSEEERKINGAVPLDDVPTWEEYYKINESSLKDRSVAELKKKFGIEPYAVIPDLNKVVSLWRGDITKLLVDAIVNAANNKLCGGSGVDGAIHRAAGKSLLQECRTLNGCETGGAKLTGGYRLPAKYVIHTAGPIGEKPTLLKSSYETSLKVAMQSKVRSIAFPCISTGVYGYPPANAAVVVLENIRAFLEENPGEFDRIIFCVFLEQDVEIYETLLQLYFPVE